MNPVIAFLVDHGYPDLADFHFLRPLWLWGLVPAGLLVWVVGWRDNVRRRWRGSIAPHLLDALVVERQRRWRVRPVHLTATLIALGAVALAGPAWEQERPPFVEDKAPLAVAIDLSRTMDAVDVSPTRLERAKLKVHALLAQRQGGRTALYAYAGSTHLVLPLTDDARLLQTFVDALQTAIMPVAGRDTVLALKRIDQDLAKEDVPGTILFLTDGVEPAATAAFRAQVQSGRSQPLILAIGTEQGGPLRSGASGFAEGRDGQRLFARLDVAALHQLKEDADVPLATITPDSDDDVEWVQRRVQSHLAQKQAESAARWKDAGWWLTIPIVFLSASWFRKGWTVRWVSVLVLGMALQIAPGPAQAESIFAMAMHRWHFIDLWLTPDQQGRQAFEHGDFAKAAQHFEDPMWRGIALYRAGHYAEAEQSFALVDSPESDYSQGNALARQGSFQAAVARYEQALKRRPGWTNAQANLKLVRALIPPKKPEEPPDDNQAQDPAMPPDQIQFDQQGKKGKQQVLIAARQTADTWMRAIQTTPTELLARKFAMEQQRAPKQELP